jgi:hypothetical protein
MDLDRVRLVAMACEALTVQVISCPQSLGLNTRYLRQDKQRLLRSQAEAPRSFCNVCNFAHGVSWRS